MYLEVTFDEKLKWDLHVQSEKASDQSHKFDESPRRNRMGANTNNLLNIYKGYVRAILECRAVCYGNTSNSILKKLNTVENRWIKICLGLSNRCANYDRSR